MKLSELFMDEGINDPYIFKAVFMAGGPGSGKSYVAKELLSGFGLKVVNSDEIFEHLLQQQELDFTMPPEEKGERDVERERAKRMSGVRKRNYLSGRLGLIIDGTAKDYSKIKSVRDRLESIGYDTRMIFVNTNIETALTRNQARYDKEGGRRVPLDIVKQSHADVQENLMRFQQLFGRDNFYIVDNSDNSEVDRTKHMQKTYTSLQRWLSVAPNDSAARAWMASVQSGGTGYPLAHPNILPQ